MYKKDGQKKRKLQIAKEKGKKEKKLLARQTERVRAEQNQ